MKFARRSLLALLLTAGLAGCSWFHFPGVYKINIQQGHIITQEMVDQLKVGMTKRQVRFVLGNSLVPDPFDNNRWDYPYSIRKGSQGDITAYLFSVYFADGKLNRWDGDFVPGRPMATRDKTSDKYLDDNRRDLPLPTNDEPKPKPEIPESN